MAAAYRMASLNSWPTAWHHCGNGKKSPNQHGTKTICWTNGTIQYPGVQLP
ncbi:hypothetical protein FOFC_03511 [Fusarium oxysporum]|nr:hypothetical protein FOFC_03511 [Fusarium oxysporum]